MTPLKDVADILRDYDGYDPTDASQLRGLIDDVVDWIDRGCPYVTGSVNGKPTVSKTVTEGSSPSSVAKYTPR
jgi:hypothetical protein